MYSFFTQKPTLAGKQESTSESIVNGTPGLKKRPKACVDNSLEYILCILCSTNLHGESRHKSI